MSVYVRDVMINREPAENRFIYVTVEMLNESGFSLGKEFI